MIRHDKISRDGIGARLRPALRARRSMARDDKGQALVLVLIAIMLFTLLVPVVVSDVVSEITNSGHGVDFEAGLAAAEAGVQQYRNLLDVDSNYWKYSSSSMPAAGDLALGAGTWQPIANTNPTEGFHYLPNTHFLPTGSGTVTPAVLLTVTGRAGAPGDFFYRTIQVTFQTTGLLTDAYFSQYETLDPQQDTAVATVKTGTGGSQITTQLTPYAVSLPAPVPDTGGTTLNLWGALCQYDDWQPNVFIDALGTPVASGGSGGTAIDNPYAPGNYTSAYPYYGPWRGNQPDSGSNNNTFTYSSGSGSATWSVSVPDPCGPVYNFVNGEHFSGPVYSDDQLWICNPGGSGGSGPTFSDGVEVGDMPAGGFQYAYPQWPAEPSSTAPGYIDDGPLDWDQSCGGNRASTGQSFGTLGVRSVPQVSPQNVDTALLTEAEVGGCVYTGPTMIEFVAGGTFNVWSPESAGTTTGFGSSAGQCGSFNNPTYNLPAGTSATDAAGSFVTGLTIPTAGLLMYVNNLSSALTPPAVAPYVTAGVLPTGATCLNPWKPYAPASSLIISQTCGVVSREGDVVTEGEEEGQATVGAQSNIVVSRDLTYQCADTSGSGGVAQQQSTSYTLPSACYTESTPDVLGLVADGDVIISKPAAAASGTLQDGFPGTCAAESVGSCSPTTPPIGANVGTDDNTPTQTEPYAWPAINATAAPGSTNWYCGQQGVGTQDGTETTQYVGDVVPDCDLQNPVIDAAIVALGGSLADEDWDAGSNDAGDAYIQGTDIAWTRGPFGELPATGYSKEFSYDTRLQYLTPPDIDLVAGLIWNASNWVSCGSVNDISQTNPQAAGVCPAIAGISG